MQYQRLFTCFICLLLIIGSGCSTKRKASKDSFIKEAYHNTTARYNAYFHGTLKLNEAKTTLITSHKDNYDTILPVYPYNIEKDGSSLSPLLDEVIKKSSKVIKMHSISKWVDDSYLAMGKAYFYQGDYADALNTFRYITTEYKAEDQEEKKIKKKRRKKRRRKRRKNEKERDTEIKDERFIDKINIFKHNPVSYEASIWIIRSYIKLNKFNEAQSVIKLLETDEKFPKRLKDELAVVKAYYFLSQQVYSSAILPLKEAIEIVKKKDEKARYHYILAQLYNKTNNSVEAMENFEKAARLTNSYIMEFHAKISIARSYQQSAGSSDKIVKLLKKMLKNEKYVEFQDQIYFSLGEIMLKENNIPEAISYFSLSARHNTRNQELKAEAYLNVANLYYQQEEYEPAKNYYDSTLMVLSKDHPQYSDLSEKKEILTELVNHFHRIEQEDTLQYFASLPSKERKKKVAEYIASMAPEEDTQPQSAHASPRQPGMINRNLPGNQNRSVNRRTWYFYDNSSKSTGYSEFEEKWGDRQLEDNWRRNSKKSIAMDNNETIENDSLEASEDEFAVNAYINKLPLSQEQIAQSDDKIAKAYYEAGRIFKEKLEKPLKAIAMFEKLEERYSESKYSKEVYYNLYLLHGQQNNRSKATFYKNKLFDKFPESLYTQLIKNPNYLEESKEKEREAGRYYEKTFSMYNENQFQEVMDRAAKANELFSENPFEPKFSLLYAMAVGNMKDKQQYKNALKDVIEKYPDDPVKKKAEEILKYLENSTIDVSSKNEWGDYSYKPDQPHRFILLVEELSVDKNRIMSEVSDFNNKYFSLKKLNTSHRLLGIDKQMIIVQSMDNKEKAMKYFNQIKDQNTIFKDLKPGPYGIMVISENNYIHLIKNKDTDLYRSFFRELYLK